MPRCSRLASRPPRITASTTPAHSHGRRRAVFRAGRRARSRAGLEAPPDQGLQPQVLARPGSRSAGHQPPRSAPPEYQGVLAALAGSDPKAAHALVTDLLSIAGITAVGGRSVGEIADRFLEQAALGAQTSLPRETARADRALPRRSRGDPDEAASRAARARRAMPQSPLDAALDLFESRTGFLAARGVDVRSHPDSPPRSAAASTTTPASSSSCTIRMGERRPAGRRRTLRRPAHAARQRQADPGGRLCRLDRAARGAAEARA